VNRAVIALTRATTEALARWMASLAVWGGWARDGYCHRVEREHRVVAGARVGFVEIGGLIDLGHGGRFSGLRSDVVVGLGEILSAAGGPGGRRCSYLRLEAADWSLAPTGS